MTRCLADLVEGSAARIVRGDASIRVSGVTADSRRVRPGSVFIAVAGHAQDGNDFLAAAAEAGAAAVVGEDPSALDGCPVNVVAVVPDARQALGHMLGVWYGRPDRRLEVLAVTGTNGKTTVAHLLRDLWSSRGQPCGLLGTIVWDTVASSERARLTTPGAEDLAALLARIESAGGVAVAMEASSHALDQQRLGEVEVDFALYTNLTRDHLDYHADLDGYLAAKLRLRDYLARAGRSKAPGRCVVNRDDDCFAALDWPDGTVFVGHGGECRIRGIAARFDRAGTEIDLDFAGERIAVRTRLVGRYNAHNLLLVAGAAHAAGVTGDEFAGHAPALRPVPGRLEPVELPDGPLALVDYAHTPDGLRSSLSAVRDITGGKIHLVFGCGGDRDRGKRPQMAEAAISLADEVYLTLDNPRTEDPEQIFRDAESGFTSDPTRARRIEDRAEAVAAALDAASRDDVVLVAGKGHEDYQLIGERRLSWDDRVALREAWGARGGTA